MNKYWLKILALSLLVSTIALAPGWTQPKQEPSTPSWADLPAETPVTITVDGFLPNETTLGRMQAGVDAQINDAVKAAVADYAGRLAVVTDRERRAARRVVAWRTFGFSMTGVALGVMVSERGDRLVKVGQGALGGALLSLSLELIHL